MVTMTSFHGEQCYRLVSVHTTSKRGLLFLAENF